MGMHSIVGGLPAEAFRFSGQSSMDAWTLKDVLREHGWAKYDRWRSQETVLFLQRVRDLVQAFPTWQHVASTGRPPTDERTLLVAMFVRQAFRAPFAKVEGLLHRLSGFFGLKKVPDANTLSEHNRGERFSTLLSRFNQFILEDLPVRECVVATDATGYGAKKRSWNDTDYGLRATEGWIKSHCAIEVPQMLYLSTVQTAGGVHESQKFADIWRELPVNVEPFRSLADTAYSGEECLQTAFDRRNSAPSHPSRRQAHEGPAGSLRRARELPNPVAEPFREPRCRPLAGRGDVQRNEREVRRPHLLPLGPRQEERGRHEGDRAQHPHAHASRLPRGLTEAYASFTTTPKDSSSSTAL